MARKRKNLIVYTQTEIRKRILGVLSGSHALQIDRMKFTGSDINMCCDLYIRGGFEMQDIMVLTAVLDCGVMGVQRLPNNNLIKIELTNVGTKYIDNPHYSWNDRIGSWKKESEDILERIEKEE